MPINQETFCPAPFRSIDIRTNHTIEPCCVIEDSKTPYTFNTFDQDRAANPELSALRQNMLDGVKSDRCRQCYEKEGYGGRSERHNQIKVHGGWPAMQAIADAVYKDPDYLHIRFGNYCNLKCIMCSPYASSSIDTEYRKNKDSYQKFGFDFGFVQEHYKNNWWENPELFNRLMKIVENARYLQFAGGEPTMLPEFTKLLDYVDHRRLDSLGMITNATNFSKSLLDKLIKINSEMRRETLRVTVCISLEGVGAHNDYLRYGSEWSDINNTIQTLQDNGVHVSLYHVIQHTTVFTFPALLEYCKENQLPIDFQPVEGGDILKQLKLNSAHPDDVAKFVEWYNTAHWNTYTTKNGSLVVPARQILDGVIRNYSFDSEMHEKFKDYVATLDQIRATDFRSTFTPAW